MDLGRLLPLDGREPSAEAITDPSTAQFQLWLAQAKRDQNNLSGRELSKIEGAASMLASRSRTMFNPFTGEVRRINSNGEVEEPTSVFLGGK
jgi:hypothetical protein